MEECTGGINTWPSVVRPIGETWWHRDGGWEIERPPESLLRCQVLARCALPAQWPRRLAELLQVIKTAVKVKSPRSHPAVSGLWGALWTGAVANGSI